MTTKIVRFFLAVGLLGAAQSVRAAETWALLVGVGKYQNEQLISSLRFPAADATSFRDALTDTQIGAVPKDHVRLLTDEAATRDGISSAFDELLKANVKPGDRVIIFLAGHGVTKGVGADAKGYFLTTDVSGLTSQALSDSALSLREFSDKLGQLPAAEFILFVDACREDPTPGRGLKPNQMSDVLGRGLQITPQNNQKPASVVTFYACSIGQRAYEDANLKHGIFTYWVLEGLRAGPVPEQADGAVYMNRLATYTRQKVGEWAGKTFGAARGAKLSTADDEDEIVTQTPEVVSLVAPPLTADLQPVMLMKVKRQVGQTPVDLDTPKLLVTTIPEGAQVSINGKLIGASPVNGNLPDGECRVRVEAPGYETEERTIKSLGGYQVQFALRLKPGGQNAGPQLDAPSAETYQRAISAEAHGDWEIAMAGYNMVREAAPKFAPAAERLANLQRLRGAKSEAAATLAELVAQVPSAHSYSLLSRAYTALVENNAASEEAPEAASEEPKKSGGLGGLFKKKKPKTPAKSPVDANATLALNAADQALKLDKKSAEAHLARGFALIAADNGGDRQNEAQMEFGMAVLLAPGDAANHNGLGYGRRIYAILKDEEARKPELQRAITAQKDALKLRPDFYEAHLELAFCYHLLGDSDSAMRQYELANANRGAASDKDEVAAANLALAALHRQESQKAGGDKQAQENAAKGYEADGTEISPDLSRAMRLLGHVGLRTRLVDFLPSAVTRWMDPASEVKSKIRNAIPIPNIPFR